VFVKRNGISLVALLGLLGCDSLAGPSNVGTITFSFTGAGGGAFSASGPAPAANAEPPTTSQWAGGGVNASTSHTIVYGARPRSGGLMDMAGLSIARHTAGLSAIDPDCNIDADVCTGMVLYLNFNGNGDSADFYCALTAGTIVISEVTGSRVRGTFAGTGECFTGAGGAPTAFSVTTGTFDVVLVAGLL
jgi:hypothetical protein